MRFLFILCLISPVVFSLLRKSLPGQPNYLEAAGTGIVLIVGIYAIVCGRKVLPNFVKIPFGFWAIYQLFYAAMAVFYDIRIGVAAILVNIVPMMMVVIAHNAVNDVEDLKKITKIFSYIGLALIPFAIIIALKGNSAVPIFMQPNELHVAVGKSTRSGIPAFAGIFSTQDVLGMVYLTVFFMAFSIINYYRGEKGRIGFYLLTALTAFLLVFLSTRRGALLAIILGGGYLFWRNHISLKIRTILIVGICLLVGLIFYLDQRGKEGLYREQKTRLTLAQNVDPVNRFIGVFLPIYQARLQDYFWGSYLGNAGAEGKSFGSEVARQRIAIETGGTKLLVETGFVGSILLPLLLIYVYWRIMKLPKSKELNGLVTTLVVWSALFFILFYFKEWTAMSGGYVSQLFFWAVPGICLALYETERKKHPLPHQSVKVRNARPLPRPAIPV